ncbi:phage adaptor protein [Phenylobacterium soli]|uniref:Uncharacterized protein n=1 Tax=Phenylobacterium soli TaxID=2170551 RepID=A0A328AJC6_9CAUL|nr:hypothetical protein [Phenylobacterium soli]RAK54890.1 hypothetical protein DJ017_10305 [Phenylobacterium soli]
MAITTYAELQAAAANWLVRADLTARIPEFIALAETRLNRALRTRLAETEQPLTGVVGARTIPLPAGFAEPLALWILRSDGSRCALRFAEPGLLAATSLRGQPSLWGVDGGALAFDRPCDQAYGFVLRMLAKFQLSDAAPTNALLADWPDVYLFATLCEAAPFLRDAELAQAYAGKLEAALAEINSKEARSRAPRTLATDLPRPRAPFDILRGS